MLKKQHMLMRQIYQVMMSNKSEEGFSLIELLVSITLSFLFIELLFHTYVWVTQQESLLREKIMLENNAQFAQFILMREIQTAGFLGCNRYDKLNIHYPDKRPYFPIFPIQIVSKASHCLGKHIHPESDLLIIEKLSSKTADLLGYQAPNKIKVNLKDRFEESDLLVITNCEKADIIAPVAVQKMPFYQVLTVSKDLHYAKGAQIGKFIATAFFIEKTHRNNIQHEPIYALYSYDLIHHRKTEYIQNIESMSFSYASFEGWLNKAFFEPRDKCPNGSTMAERISLIKINLQLRSENALLYPYKVLRKNLDIIVNLRNLNEK